MNTVWVICGVAAIGGLVALVKWLQQSDQPADMGAVSHQWIAEHRLGQGNDSRQ